MGICVSRVFRQIQGGRQRSLRNGNQGSATGQKDQKASLSHLLKTTHKICHHRRPENTPPPRFSLNRVRRDKKEDYTTSTFSLLLLLLLQHSSKDEKQPLYASIPCR